MFDLSYFMGKNYFDGDESQNYLIFESVLGIFRFPVVLLVKY